MGQCSPFGVMIGPSLTLGEILNVVIAAKIELACLHLRYLDFDQRRYLSR